MTMSNQIYYCAYLSVGVGVGVIDGVTVYVDQVGVGVISVTVVNTSDVDLTFVKDLIYTVTLNGIRGESFL
jgi:hypothetical protein